MDQHDLEQNYSAFRNLARWRTSATPFQKLLVTRSIERSERDWRHEPQWWKGIKSATACRARRSGARHLSDTAAHMSCDQQSSFGSRQATFRFPGQHEMLKAGALVTRPSGGARRRVYMQGIDGQPNVLPMAVLLDRACSFLPQKSCSPKCLVNDRAQARLRRDLHSPAARTGCNGGLSDRPEAICSACSRHPIATGCAGEISSATRPQARAI